MRPAFVIAAAFALASGFAGAQRADAGPGAEPEVYDLHVVALDRPTWDVLPQLRPEIAKRYRIFANADADGRHLELLSTKGSAPYEVEFDLERIEASSRADEPNRERRAGLRFSYRQQDSNSSFSTNGRLPLEGGVIHGNLPRRRRARFALLLPRSDASAPLEPLTLEGFATTVADFALAPRASGGADPNASTIAEILSRLPLAKLVDAERCRRLRQLSAFGPAEPTLIERGLAYLGGERSPSDSPGFVVRLLAGDAEVLRGWGENQRNHVAFRPAMWLAFLQEEEPKAKGEIGWFGVKPSTQGDDDENPHARSHRRGLGVAAVERPFMPGLVVPLHHAVREGRAILPGSEAERNRRSEWLAALAAEADVGPALPILGGALLALLALTLGLRRASKSVLF